MESIYEGLNQLGELIIWPYMVIFILLSYMVKKYLGKWLNKITQFEWKAVYTVLIIATIVAVPYILFTGAIWNDILLTYAIGTSFHELILGRIIAEFTKGRMV